MNYPQTGFRISYLQFLTINIFKCPENRLHENMYSRVIDIRRRHILAFLFFSTGRSARPPGGDQADGSPPALS